MVGEVAQARARHTFASVLCNIVLGAFYSLFVIAHFTVEREWSWTETLPIITLQSIMALVFLTRRPSLATSRRPLDWIVAIAGTLCPMLLRPTPTAGALSWLGHPLMTVGLLLCIFALLSIGRSMGVVPANRGLQTGGAYRVVRHPVYAAYLVYFSGYLMSSPSAANAVVVAMSFTLLLLRVVFEERFLAQTAAYRAYRDAVRWRVVPGVF